MFFTSITFIFYFLPLVLILYYMFSFSGVAKNIVLFAASLFFYSWGNIGHVLVLLLSIFVNYILGLAASSERKSVTRLVMLLMCAYNLGVLFVFKYMNFTFEGINSIFNTSLPFVELGLPVGISFFTFKAMSYVIDVYRKKVRARKNIFDVALYISFFPQIEAGPVVQYASADSQISERKETMRMFSLGVCRFVTGLAKKVLIANQMAVVADNIFLMSSEASVPAALAWVGSIAFTLQIFFDISGYSDIAIGLCLMFGVRVDENFNYPYISKTVTEFWRRWHISLTQWFREYVYNSLGGKSLDNKDLVMRNLIIVWLLQGLWHGAEWTFIIWGLLNFMFIFLEKITGIERINTHNIIRRIYTLFVVNLLWVVFRSENLIDAGRYIESMFGVNGFYSPYATMFIRENIVFFVIGIILSTPIARRMNRYLVDKAVFSSAINVLYPIYMAVLFVICISYISKDIQYPFIYFNY